MFHEVEIIIKMGFINQKAMKPFVNSITESFHSLSWKNTSVCTRQTKEFFSSQHKQKAAAMLKVPWKSYIFHQRLFLYTESLNWWSIGELPGAYRQLWKSRININMIHIKNWTHAEQDNYIKPPRFFQKI